MRFVFLAGGFVGFLITGGFSLWAGHEGNRIFLDAAVGCLAGAMLFRWLWTVMLRGVRDSQIARAQAPVPPAPVPVAKTK